MQSGGTDVKEYGHFVQNEWRKAADNKSFEVREPYSGNFFARAAAGSRADARVAVDAAAKAALCPAPQRPQTEHRASRHRRLRQ